MKQFQLKLTNIAALLLLVFVLAETCFSQTDSEKIVLANNLVTEAYALFEQGTAESYRAALEKFQEANRLFKETGDKSENVGISLTATGLILSRLGRQTEALKIFETALIFVRAHNYAEVEGIILNNMAETYSGLGEKPKAIEYFSQAVELSRKTGNQAAEAASLSNLGAAYSNVGENQKALEYLNQALPVLRAVGNQKGEAYTLNNIGSIYLFLGEYIKAAEYYLQSLPLFRRLGDKAGEASALNNLGGISYELGGYEQALKDYNQSLLLNRAAGDRTGESRLLNNIGGIYDALGDRQKALENYRQSLQISREIGDRAGEATALNNIGGIYEALGERQKALDYFRLSLPLSRYVGNKNAEALTLGRLKAFYNSEKNPRLAIFYGKQAVGLYQQLRSKITGLDKAAQKSYLKVVEPFYRSLADLLIKENRLAEAQQILNLFKDQQFFDFNRNANEPVKQIVKTPRETIFSVRFEKSLDLISRLNQALDDLKREAENNAADSQKAAQLQKAESDLKIADDDFAALLKQSAAEFSASPDESDKTPTVSDLMDLQKSLTDLNLQTGQKTVAVYTLVGIDNFRALIVSSDGIKAVSAPIKGEELNDLALRYWKLLQSDKYEPKVLSKQIYDAAFKFVEAELPKETTTIMWSLDGDLRYLPPAALYDGKQYLIEKYGHVVFTRADAERMTRSLRPNWTGIGFGSSEAQTIELSGDRISFSSLSGVNEELAKIFKQSNSSAGSLTGEVLTNQKFTKQKFFEALKTNRPVVHIASHFVFRPGDESRSFLLLGDGSTLTLDEMKRQTNLFAGVDLLTLSACETAASQADATGREIDGFAELAQRLGAGAVIASLWQVADESTAQLMSEFYKLKTNNPKISKAEAMRQIQISMLKGEQQIKRTNEKRSDLASSAAGDGEGFTPFKRDATKPFAHPYYWSPFVLIGNWK